jgi:sugar transferase (PEP-CTERM system associated)
VIRFLHAYFPKRTLFLGLSEVCLITLALTASAFVRLGVGEAGAMLTGQHGSLKILLVAMAFMTCMYYFDLYDSAILSNRREALIRLIQVLGVAYVVLGLIYYLYPRVKLGRGIFHIGFILVAILLLIWRKLFSLVNSTPQLAEHVVILGNGQLAQSLVAEITSRPELGIRAECCARLPESAQSHSCEEAIDIAVGGAHRVACAATFNPALEYRLRGVDRIVVALEERRGNLPVDLLLSLKNRGIQVQDGNELYESITGKIPIQCIRLGWLLFSPGCYASRLFSIYKRLASISASLLGLLLSLPLMPLVCVAIKLSSSGPIFYRQQRVGRDGAIFYCYKLRTMRADAEADTGPTWAKDDDPRITRVGAFLRKTRIDEIPQLWNVLKGEMSLVGPRPERPEFVQALAREIPHYDLRHSIRPGITGWAQISYRYGNSVDDAREKLRYDLYYIKNMSMGLDILIMFSTIKTIVFGIGAK